MISNVELPPDNWRWLDLPYADPDFSQTLPGAVYTDANVVSVPGFSDVPLTVDVFASTPDPLLQLVPQVLTYDDPIPPADVVYLPPAPLVAPSVERAQVPDPITGDIVMAADDFLGGIDFPSARDILGGALNLASQFISNVPAEQSGAMTLRVPATVCPTQGTHPRKQPVVARKSIVTTCVRNRHMNSLNPKALRRATRRLNGFMSHVRSAEKAIRHALGHTIKPGRTRTAGGRRACVQCGRGPRSCQC